MDKLIEDGVKVDMILTDPPYGTTQCKWDSVIPLDKMWERINKLTTDTTPILLFGSEPYGSLLRTSNIKNYKYDWIWEKEQGTNQLNAKIQPLRKHENICVFYKKQPTYNPQMEECAPYTINRNTQTELYNAQKPSNTVNTGTRYPTTILKFNRELKNRLHPTQKPVALLEYLVKTYTNEGDTVLDNCMGSGSTGVACVNTNREFIGMELDEKYYKIACERLGAQ